ncbi:centromere protein H (CENP-H)-domain-containing protein [Xylaria sp. CBS 124048]|nr:centromere protein H (CENP-H)-domain-containing protein [Xylaria sp. CBS 124048]
MEDQQIDLPSPLPLSDMEKRALDLHDKLQQLQLEIALLKAQRNYVPDTLEPSVEIAQRELLDARSKYMLRNEVVANVTSVYPIMQALHQGSKASPVERDLLPLLVDRDAATTTLASQDAELHSLLDDLKDVESRSLRLGTENVALAERLLDLARQTDQGQTELLPSEPEHADTIAGLNDEVKTSRQRWRVLKDTASAIVAGSGVDWANDAELRDIVLDPAED